MVLSLRLLAMSWPVQGLKLQSSKKSPVGIGAKPIGATPPTVPGNRTEAPLER